MDTATVTVRKISDETIIIDTKAKFIIHHLKIKRISFQTNKILTNLKPVL